MEMPPLHNQYFGGEGESGRWEGVFTFLPSSSTWQFAFVDEYDVAVKELTGTGATPLDAFEGCVKRYIYLNNHQESPTLKELLPILRNYFNEDGSVKLEHMLAL